MGCIHPVEGKPPQASFSLHTLAGTSEHSDSHVLGNHEESSWVDAISSNYIDSGESYNKSTTVDNHFSCMIANDLHSDSDPKTMAMAECKPLAQTETVEECNPSRK